MENHYKQVSDQRYEIIMKRCEQFTKGLNVPNSEPVKVFDPLSKKLIDELMLIREVSKDLQKKKEEDINKAAKAAEQAEEDAKKKAQEEAAKAKLENEDA